MGTDFAKELIKVAETYLGTTDGGTNSGATVEMFQRAVDGKAQKEPWCMAFVQFCVQQVQLNFSCTAVLFETEHCLTAWNRTPESHKFSVPAPGRIVVWRHGTSSNGHTGIVTKVMDSVHFETVEGNTAPGDGVVERDGDGVYRKTRSMKTIGTMSVVGFIEPFYPMRAFEKVS